MTDSTIPVSADAKASIAPAPAAAAVPPLAAAAAVTAAAPVPAVVDPYAPLVLTADDWDSIAAAQVKQNIALLVGPVIGKTTDTTTRILIELDGDAKVMCILTRQTGEEEKKAAVTAATDSAATAAAVDAKADAKSDVKSAAAAVAGSDIVRSIVQFYAHRPKVFKFSGLKPGSVYSVRFNGFKGSHLQIAHGSFRTFDPAQTKFNIVAYACDHVEKGVGKRGGSDKPKPKPDSKTPASPAPAAAAAAELPASPSVASNNNPSPSGVVVAGNLFHAVRQLFVEPRKADLIIRHGDQVYADKAHAEGLKIFADKKIDSLVEKRARMAEAYRRIYRNTWSMQDSRGILANVPHLMLWDDHELRNDWGTFPRDHDPKHADFEVCTFGARVAYWEYQRQLWDDIPHFMAPPVPAAHAVAAATSAAHAVLTHTASLRALNAAAAAGAGATPASPTKPPAMTRMATSPVAINTASGGLLVGGAVGVGSAASTTEALAAIQTAFEARMKAGVSPEGSIHAWGQFGVLICDARGGRSFNYNAADQHKWFGDQQWNAFSAALKPDGALGKTRTLLVVNSTAPVLMSTWASRQVGRISAQTDKMGLGLFPKEQCELLTTLAEWRARTSGQCYLLGGDLHFGIETDVFTGDSTDAKQTLVLRQVISSAISNSPPPGIVYWGLLRPFLKAEPTLIAAGASDASVEPKASTEPNAVQFRFRHNRYTFARNFVHFSCAVTGAKAEDAKMEHQLYHHPV